jgi:hypothetical protein
MDAYSLLATQCLFLHTWIPQPWISPRHLTLTEFVLLSGPNNSVMQNLLTYSMEQGTSWEANWFAASQEFPHVLWNPKVPHRTHKRPPPVSILSQPNPVLTRTSHLLKIHPNIILPSTPRSPQRSLSLKGTPYKIWVIWRRIKHFEESAWCFPVHACCVLCCLIVANLSPQPTLEWVATRKESSLGTGNRKRQLISWGNATGK